jgi:hypothetical protein
MYWSPVQMKGQQRQPPNVMYTSTAENGLHAGFLSKDNKSCNPAFSLCNPLFNKTSAKTNLFSAL